MKQLHPDDFVAGKLVTILAGPFEDIWVPPSVRGDSPGPRREDKSLHGKVFELIAYSPPLLMLRPLDGMSPQQPSVQGNGPFAMILQPAASFTPQVMILHYCEGELKLAEVDQTWAAAYIRYCCPPRENRKKVPTMDPLKQMLMGTHDCDHCDKAGDCPIEAEVKEKKNEGRKRKTGDT